MSKLEKSAIKEMLYGGLMELTDNFKYYHKNEKAKTIKFNSKKIR